MATLDLQEQEQVDALKAWWRDNGKWLVAAAVIALLGYAGMHFWKNHQAQQAGEAARLYVEVKNRR